MRTRSRSRHKIAEPLRIEFHSQEDQFQEDPPEVPMADNRTMAQLLQAPTVGYDDAIVIPEIATTNFELKHGLINLVQNKQFFGHDKEDPSTIKLMLFPFSLEVAARIWLEKEPPRSIITWDNLVSKFINQACLHHRFSELHQLDTFYNALNVNDQDSLNSAAGGNFLDKMPSDCLKIIERKSKVRQSRAKAVVAKVNSNSSTPAILSDVAELKDIVRALMLDKKNQSSAPATSPTSAPVTAVESNCVTCGGTHSYQNCPATSENVYQDSINEPLRFPPVQNNQNNFNRGNNSTQNRGGNFNQSAFNQSQLHRPQVNQAPAYQAPIPQMQNVSQTDFKRYVKANDVVLRNIQSQGQSTQNQCQNIQNQYQMIQNQLANLTDMMSKFMSSNMASSSGSGTLPGNTITNPKEDLKALRILQ
nr:hypothetical protein [Tanacetum cinerariifolium]